MRGFAECAFPARRKSHRGTPPERRWIYGSGAEPAGIYLAGYFESCHLRARAGIDIVAVKAQWGDMKKRRRTQFGKDKRRKHRHWQVTVFYHDGEKFARVYTDHDKAVKFAERQRKSPVVKLARVLQVS